MRKAILAVLISCVASSAFAGGDMRYRRIGLEDAACDVGLLYSPRSSGADIVVSAIATGKGAEFRKWEVTDMRLRTPAGRLRPSAEGKFFVNKESFFRVPAAVVFAALGTQIPASGNTFSKGITRTGAAIGLGVLALTAKGDMAGRRCVFSLDAAAAAEVAGGDVCVEITIENRDLHLKRSVEACLGKPEAGPAKAPDYGAFTQDELRSSINALGMEAEMLRKEQAAFKGGADGQYEEMQRKIDDIETRRGIAYKVWYERDREESVGSLSH